jgi:hypothetical protein
MQANSSSEKLAKPASLTLGMLSDGSKVYHHRAAHIVEAVMGRTALLKSSAAFSVDEGGENIRLIHGPASLEGVATVRQNCASIPVLG